MSLAKRLAQLDSELDALSADPATIEDVRARVLSAHSSDLGVVDAELQALAADVAGLDAVLDAAREQAASRSADVTSLATERAERAKAARAEVEARVAAMTAEQDAARAARAERTQREAQEREAAATERAQREAQALEAAAGERAQREEQAQEAAAAAERTRRDAQVLEEAAREAAAAAAASESAADTLGQLLADELDELADAPTNGALPAAMGANPDDTDIFGTDLFGDLGADAFDAPQDAASDVVTSEGPALAPSMLGDLAGLLEQEESAATEAQANGAQANGAQASESDELMAALFDATTETALPDDSEPPPRPKTVPPPVPTDSVRPPSLEAAVLEGARESFEDLSDELDVLEVDDFDIVIDETPMSEGDGTGTELDGPGLTEAELERAAAAASQTAEGDAELGDDSDNPEKKGFFKKLFG